MKVFIDYDAPFAGMAIFFYEDRPDGRYIVLPSELNFKKLVPGENLEPTYRLDHSKGEEFLQSLSNALVEAGFKPDEIKAGNKEVEALRYHLEDMRKLVFKGK